MTDIVSRNRLTIWAVCSTSDSQQATECRIPSFIQSHSFTPAGCGEAGDFAPAAGSFSNRRLLDGSLTGWMPAAWSTLSCRLWWPCSEWAPSMSSSGPLWRHAATNPRRRNRRAAGKLLRWNAAPLKGMTHVRWKAAPCTGRGSNLASTGRALGRGSTGPNTGAELWCRKAALSYRRAKLICSADLSSRRAKAKLQSWDRWVRGPQRCGTWLALLDMGC